MSIRKYTEHPRVVQEIDELKKHLAAKPLHVSDISDDAGHQYIDLVQEGGGVLGIALLGYTYTLETIGIRFFSLAGTSAGAINTAFLAAAGKPHEKKSEKILEILDRKDLMDFVDGGRDAKRLVKVISAGKSIGKIMRTALNQVDDFFIRGELGVNRGDNFYEWLVGIFADFGIRTTQDLVNQMNDFPETMIENICSKFSFYKPQNLKAKLSIIATDITTQTKADLPEMGDLYYYEPMNINPAYYVRASMAIPVFFDPLIVENIPNNEEQKAKWASVDKAFYFGDIPDKVVLVDGGVMSNFPIDIFHVQHRIPTRPTFGVKLGIDRVSELKNDSIFQIIWNSFAAARQMRDHDVIIKNQDFNKLIRNIDDSGINWLSFDLPDESKIELFTRGVEAACDFIKNFDWNNYKGLRNDIILTKKATYTKYTKPEEGYIKNIVLKK